MAAYRITARALERHLVGEQILGEFASLEDLSVAPEKALVPAKGARKFVLVLEDEDSPLAGAPRPPK